MPDLPDNWHRVIALARRQQYPDVADAMEDMAESGGPRFEGQVMGFDLSDD